MSTAENGPDRDPEVSPSSDRRLVYCGRKIDLALQTVTLNDGTQAEREVVLHRGAVVLIPMVDRDRVCLLRNYRYSVRETLLELPAGTVDAGETPEATAPRELAEETGYRAGRITRLADWWVSPGVFTERMVLFLCEELTPGPTAHQPDEQMECVVLDWDEAVQQALDGRISDAKTRLGLLLADRQRWSEPLA